MSPWLQDAPVWWARWALRCAKKVPGLRWGVDARKKVGDLITRKSGVRWIYQADVLEILYVLFSLGYSQYMSNWRFNFSHQELGWLKINIFLGIEWDVYIYIFVFSPTIWYGFLLLSSGWIHKKPKIWSFHDTLNHGRIWMTRSRHYFRMDLQAIVY